MAGLLLLMAHLLRKHRVWQRCALRLHLITETGTDRAALRERVHTLLARINISASVEEVLEVDSSSLLPYMQEERTMAWQQRHNEMKQTQRASINARPKSKHSAPRRVKGRGASRGHAPRDGCVRAPPRRQ